MKIRSSREMHPSLEHYGLIDRAIAQVLSEENTISDWARHYAKGQRDRLAHDLALISKYAKKSDKVCEFGSVPLFLTLALKNYGFDVTGVDIAPERFASAMLKFSLSVIKSDIEHEVLPFAGATFDVVVFNELFEHLRINPIFTMREVRRIIKNNGVMLLSTPNLRSIVGIRNFLLQNMSYSCSGNVYEEFSKLNELGHMGHVREYTTAEMINFLHKVGFRVEELIFRGELSNMLDRALCFARPSMRPFVTYVTYPIN